MSWFNRIIYFFNVVLTLFTVIAYILPLLAPKIFPFLSVFTLLMPLMLILNFCFFMYWLLQAKRQMLLSGLVLLLGITFISKMYRFSEDVKPQSEADFTIMSYNVRIFNMYDWIKKKDIAAIIANFIREKNPDVVCLQEFTEKGKLVLEGYNKYIYSEKGMASQAIYSKYPIVNTGRIPFENSVNNVSYADIVKNKDTLRIYSMHMQSLRISPDIKEEIDEEKSKMIFKRISRAFAQQQQQAEVLTKHTKECPYPVIICGDLNNSAFSYVYRLIKGERSDAFEEAGVGFGKSYDIKYYPLRIDYIFSDKSIEVKQFDTFDSFVNSDHYPVMARLAFKKEEKED